MMHRIILSNGRVMIVEEQDQRLLIAYEEEGSDFEVGWNICVISRSGVLVMPNSGDATEMLTEGLTQD